MSILLYQQTLLKSCFSLRCLQFSSIVFNINSKKRFCSKPAPNDPLLDIKTLPKYNEITSEIVQNAIPILVKETESKYAQFENELQHNKNYSWENVINNSDLITDKLGLAWGAVTHLHSVKNNEKLRSAYQKVLPDVVKLVNGISQSKPVYQALHHLKDSTLDEAQHRIIKASLRSAKHSGVHLEGDEKERFNKILQELAELGSKFMNNVLDSTKSFSHIIYDKKDLDGLPDTLLPLLASSASTELNETIDPYVGPWKLSLDMPCFEPFMKHSRNEVLREKIYRSYIKRASSGDYDNSDIIERIRILRKEKSQILGYKNYAELSLSSKMADDTASVWKMIHDLKSKAKHVAENEMKVLQKFATSHGFKGDMKHWDVSFWSERQREQLLDLNEQKLREYFPFKQVLTGLFSLAEELFSIQIVEVSNSEFESWHEDVKFFNITDKSGSLIASFFLDPYSRPEEKQGGAWMDSALGRNDALGRKPVAYLVCNQSPPIGDTPSLLTFREVLTLFHEFGHGLQHMLTSVKYPSAAGINNVEWDAVELPSQFMENWLYDWSTVQKISAHYTTREVLPKQMFEQICKGRKYQAGMGTLRQLYFSALDMELHTSDDDWHSVMKHISNDYTIMKPLEGDAFPCAFMHIFSGGYAAGYYSYKWAEVLSADAFAAFEEAGLHNRDQISKLGKRFHDTVLSQGGSRHPEEIFSEFRGRKPTVDALLKSYGLT